ncbi:hypothetical protein [Microvirga mediterraneensis]|uniref:Lipoprotein n=1 Tax=Microvirga mediterraneensis TaxID=2754695 RepID=A0A838BK44_9HYPH|nr:hypothetical protein [Microvirga mediterraneensis]MBA1155092.1 hypothetical protein [Microvirga mediterraneensis]
MKRLAALALVFVLGGCVSARQLPDDANPALMVGEAAYLTTRCPKLKQERQMDALVVACLLNKANGIDCPTAMTRHLETDLLKGMVKAKQEFASIPDAQVCRTATERYGKNGSRFKNMLIPK